MPEMFNPLFFRQLAYFCVLVKIISIFHSFAVPNIWEYIKNKVVTFFFWYDDRNRMHDDEFFRQEKIQ